MVAIGWRVECRMVLPNMNSLITIEASVWHACKHAFVFSDRKTSYNTIINKSSHVRKHPIKSGTRVLV